MCRLEDGRRRVGGVAQRLRLVDLASSRDDNDNNDNNNNNNSHSSSSSSSSNSNSNSNSNNNNSNVVAPLLQYSARKKDLRFARSYVIIS